VFELFRRNPRQAFFLQVVLVDDAARLAVGVEDREEGLAWVAPEELEDGIDALVLVDGRPVLYLLADEDLVERLAGSADAADIGQMRKGGLQFVEEGRRPGDEVTLHEIDAILAAGHQLGLRLDAFGNDADAQYMGDVDDILD